MLLKCDKNLLQNASGFLLQNATVLLQKATFITNCDSTCSIKVVTRYQGKQVSLLSFERKGKQVRIQLPIQHLSEVKILKLLMFFTISN